MKKYIFVFSLIFALGASGMFAQMKQTLSSPAKQSIKAAAVEEQLDEGPQKKTLSGTTKKTTNTAVTTVKSGKPIKGQIMDFSKIVLGANGKINKAEALALIEKGKPVVFKAGGKIYFVLNTDGSYAAKNLAKYANNKFIGIIGKVKKIKGVNYIIAEKIESMD